MEKVSKKGVGDITRLFYRAAVSLEEDCED